jgi:hypothetical protein
MVDDVAAVLVASRNAAVGRDGPEVICCLDRRGDAATACVYVPNAWKLKGANIGVAARWGGGWEDRRYGVLLLLPRRAGFARRARS